MKKRCKGMVITMSGNDADAERKNITDVFRQSDGIILISTDAAAEGLNLHDRCRHLIHLELPFNPNRLEQRNGRIDRYGQKHTPHIRYMYLLGSFEDRMLLRLIMKHERQRDKLKFVPNTLGIPITSERAAKKMLDSLAQEENLLFKTEDIFSKSPEANENEGVDAAALDLLEEIDHSLEKFRKASRTNTWISNKGMNADEKINRAAYNALQRGEKAGLPNIVDFVKNAVLMDGGDINEVEPGIFQLLLPPAWRFGLDALPGYDPDSHRILLSENMEITRDSSNNSVGYLGRAHPLVRKALDRVRNITYTGTGKYRLDPRSSAVKYDGDVPALLFTFLGRVTSRIGREYEQITAVYLDKNGKMLFYPHSADWKRFADPSKAIRTADIWEKTFMPWAEDALDEAKKTAHEEFNIIADAFRSNFLKTMEKEMSDLMFWLEKRCMKVTSEFKFKPVQLGLFDKPEDMYENELNSSYRKWMDMEKPEEKLAAFYMDRNIPIAKRSEADGVLHLFKRRKEFLEDRMSLKEPEIALMGLLMLVPEA